MANTETSVTELKINKLTKAQYDGITTPSNTELYFVKDEAIDYDDLVNTPNLATVATTGDFYDLINFPDVKQSDWNEQDSSDISYIKNKPNLATVAISGSYTDLINQPTIPEITNNVTQNSTDALTSGGAYTNLISTVEAGNTANKINVTKNGQTSTITINNVANATNATTASKLGSTTVGSTSRPIYINNGTATQISYTIEKSVPADAKFTDTTYGIFTGATSSADGESGLVKKPVAGDQNKFLKGDGNWAVVDSFPSQSGNAGKYLTTNGTVVSWANVPEEIPSQSGNSGKFLTTNGTSASWANISQVPAQSGQSGKFLTTNGTTASWTSLSASDIPNLTLSKITDVTATAAEVNVLDGITASTSELNILDGVTASTSELNILDGATLTTTELNYVDGVTSSIQTQLDNKVDKVNTASKIYGTNSSSAQTTYSLSSSATASTIAYRGSGGVLQVGTPTANAHATTKKYVDDLIAADYALQIIDYTA